MVAQAASILCVPNLTLWPVPMAVMAAGADILSFAVIKICGRYYTFVIIRMCWPRTVRVEIKII